MDDDDLPRHRFWRLPDDPEDQERVIEAVQMHEPGARVHRDIPSVGSLIELKTVPARVAAVLMGCTPNRFPSPK